MSEFRFTPSQARAIGVRGRPVLVSAGAGSGKTRVLTERLIARVLEGEDVTRFLVITFTRAAAAELRGRILKELNARAAADPADRRLRRQSALLYRAQIGTIDSFCAALVRENAHLLGIAPSFSVLDEDRAQAMRSRALEDVLDRAYETIEENGDLRLLVDSVGAGRDDSRLAELVLAVDDRMQSHAFPERWAAEKLAALDVAGLTDAAQTPWGRYLLDDAGAEAAYRAEELERALGLMAQPENAPDMGSYPASFDQMALLFRDLARAAADGWDATRAVLDRPAPRLGRMGKDADPALKDRVKAVWDGAKKALEKLRRDLAGDSAALLAGTAASRAPLTALMELVWALQAEYAARKRRADACDFADVERLCAKLLCDENGGPTALAGAVSGRFAEVMVDEYQDVNGLQELIFRRVSGEGKDLFMVGDVKQSVYRFRLAEPAIFNAKYDAFGAGDGERVLLRENFRSRPSVLNACNAVFSRIMSPALGDVAYNDEARLIPGAEYPARGEVKPELCLLEAAGAEGEDTPDKVRLEARYVAGRIRAMVEDREMISDGLGGMRPVRYGDIALLLRTPGTTGAAFRRALTEAGVPVSARQGGAFFAQPEVSFTLSMLAVIDNPRQDVPLIAALRGLPFGFTPDELSAVRAAARGDLWDALLARAREDGRCERFVSLVQELRSFAREEPTDSLLRRLYDRTELMTVCGVMTDAGRRIADLMQLYEYAWRFEQGGGRGLFRFVSWLRELEKRGLEPPAPNRDDAVQLMSVHKAKGLEFPVVFLADLGHGWNARGGAQVLCHGALGLGMRMTDTVRGVQWPTLPWRAIDRLTRREELSEQERVLYVAMTRARERLIMTCVRRPSAEKQALSSPAEPGPVAPRVLMQARSAASWLVAAAAADGGETIQVKLVTPGGTETERSPETRERPAGDGELVKEIGDRLAWRYPFAASVALPSKLTATGAGEMAYGGADPDAAELPRQGGRVADRLRRPDFGRTGRPLSGAERGVAAHLVMQHIDLARTASERDIRDEIARMERMGFLDGRQAAAVDPADILAFFRSPLGARLLGAEKVVREFKFSLLCPAGLWYPQAPEGERILLQGVVDCCIREGDALTVIDFKTDARIEPGRYDGQLRAYAAAMERIYGLPVKQAALWYLRLRKAAYCPLPEEKTGIFP